MSRKRYKKNNKNKKNNKIINFIFLFIFVFIMIFSGTKIFIWLKENKENRDIINSLKNTVSIDNKNKYNVDFQKLKEVNKDTVAWIKVNGTNIEYPVVKATNNEYYLNHSFEKKYSTAGWVFMDYKNKVNGTDNNIVIFGHNRRDGSMFGSLKNILTDEWQENKDNFIIPFITENEQEEYQVFSIYRIEKEDYYITTNFKSDDEFKEFINKLIQRSQKDFGVEVTTKDKLLTLSTCANDNRYRVVLHAKKIK